MLPCGGSPKKPSEPTEKVYMRKKITFQFTIASSLVYFLDWVRFDLVGPLLKKGPGKYLQAGLLGLILRVAPPDWKSGAI